MCALMLPMLLQQARILQFTLHGQEMGLTSAFLGEDCICDNNAIGSSGSQDYEDYEDYEDRFLLTIATTGWAPRLAGRHDWLGATT